jgi:hypothetical protein
MRHCLFGTRPRDVARGGRANQVQGPKGAIIRRCDVYSCDINDMAITHFRASIIQGARGPVAAAAYRHRAGMYDMAAARTWDYSGAGDLAHAEIALPDDAPAWIAAPAASMSSASLSDLLWNAAAQAEQRYDAQTAREITIALPIELTQPQNIALVREFVSAEFVSRGFAVD